MNIIHIAAQTQYNINWKSKTHKRSTEMYVRQRGMLITHVIFLPLTLVSWRNVNNSYYTRRFKNLLDRSTCTHITRHSSLAQRSGAFLEFYE